MVSILASHAGYPGSSPGIGNYFLFCPVDIVHRTPSSEYLYRYPGTSHSLLTSLYFMTIICVVRHKPTRCYLLSLKFYRKVVLRLVYLGSKVSIKLLVHDVQPWLHNPRGISTPLILFPSSTTTKHSSLYSFHRLLYHWRRRLPCPRNGAIVLQHGKRPRTRRGADPHASLVLFNLCPGNHDTECGGASR